MANYVSRAIESVLDQTYPHFEIWVINDGSTDHFTEVLQSFIDPRLHIVHQHNAGVSVSRNTGIAHATSEYVAFLDADDHWEPDFLSSIAALITAYPEAVFYATNFSINGQPHLEVDKVKTFVKTGSQILVQDYFEYFKKYDMRVTSSSVAIRKDVLKNIGGFPVGIHSGEDMLVWARIAVLGGLGFESRVLSYYERDDNIRPPDSSEYVVNQLKSLYEQHSHLSNLKYYIGEWYLIQSRLCLHNRRPKLGINFMIDSFKWGGFSLKKLLILLGFLIPYTLLQSLLKQRWVQYVKQHLY
jgi:glycosyltransferase involved in cell wall biosynthesis